MPALRVGTGTGKLINDAASGSFANSPGSYTAGNMLCIAGSLNDNANTLTNITVAGNTGGAWTVKLSARSAGGNIAFIAFLLSAPAGITSVTTTMVGAGTCYAVSSIDQYSGVSAFDQINSSVGTSLPSGRSTGNITNTNSGDLIVAAFGSDDSATTDWDLLAGVASTGTLIHNEHDTTAHHASLVYYQIASGSTGPFSATARYPDETAAAAALIVSFTPGSSAVTVARKAAAGPGVSPSLQQQFRAAPRNFTTPSTDVTVALTGVSATTAVGTVTAMLPAVLGALKRPGPGIGPFSNGQFIPAVRGFGFANPDVTVALTGVSGTGSAGTVTPSTTVAVTGNAGTGAAGTVTPAASLALSGVAGTSAAGSVTPSTTVGLTGVSGTGAVGSVSTGGDVTVALIGVQGTSAAGTLTPGTTVATTGNAGAGAVGTLAPSTSIGLTGNSATGAVGDVTAGATGDVTVALTGVGAVSQVGSITASGGTTADVFSGGFVFAYEHEMESRRRQRRKRKDDEEQALAAVETPFEREIATLLHAQEAQDERRAELARLQRLVTQFAERKAEQAFTERVSRAFERAIKQPNASALLALEREVERQMDDEDFAVLMMLALD